MNETFGFDTAIRLLKDGRRVAREGWNGKGMWIAMTPGSAIAPKEARLGAARHMADQGDLPPVEGFDDTPLIVIRPHIDMRAADGTLVIGWLASQTDMLADDWMVVP